MTTARQMAAALTQTAHSERIALAVKDLLLGDTVVSKWCGDRVFRVPESTLFPERPRPMITIAPDLVGLPLRLQGETEIELRLLVTLFFSEPREILEDDERGIDTMLHHLWRVLAGTREARSLQVARYSHRALVQRSPTSADQTLADVVDVLDDGTPVVHRQPQLQITYRYVLNRNTGQPEGFEND